jgi:hypothetical protein
VICADVYVCKVQVLYSSAALVCVCKCVGRGCIGLNDAGSCMCMVYVGWGFEEGVLCLVQVCCFSCLYLRCVSLCQVSI